jgi:uncharacterized protein YbjT (DUF2867 family)
MLEPEGVVIVAEQHPIGRIAVVGATGYLGGRLVAELLRQGFGVRAVARSIEKMRCRPYAASPGLEMARADACREDELTRALEGCSCCCWLISTAGRSDDLDRDMTAAARSLVRSAPAASVSRIIHLGPPERKAAIGSEAEGLGTASVGRILMSGPVPVTWLRTAMIIGSGSASFEVLRYLTERLPVMPAPRWARKPIRPIAVSDVIRCLAACVGSEDASGLITDIGGPEILSFRDLMDLYADVAGIPRRVILPLPLEAKGLSAYGINLVTPVPFDLARRVLEYIDLGSPLPQASSRGPLDLSLTGVRHAIETALRKERRHEVESCWSDAGGLTPPEWLTCGDAGFAGGEVMDCSYRILLNCPPERVWAVLSSVGGRQGWFFGDILWKLRGFLDRLLGGVGLSRGRRSARDLRTGDAVDFWRVLLAEENRRLVLLAEMKVPGEAVLQFSLNPQGHACELIQVARFLPRGLSGRAYWYAMAPFHDALFKGMLLGIAQRCGCSALEEPKPFRGGGEVCRLPEDWGRRT